jgi:hypothetical protein
VSESEKVGVSEKEGERKYEQVCEREGKESENAGVKREYELERE